MPAARPPLRQNVQSKRAAGYFLPSGHSPVKILLGPGGNVFSPWCIIFDIEM
jgi:hypothetical protein